MIVRGGQMGTTVAARLFEDSSKTVLLIETGRTNPNITDIYNYGKPLRTPMEWQCVTDIDRGMRGGRTLDGSTIGPGGNGDNSMLSHDFSEEDADVDCNFDSLQSCLKKSESLYPSDDVARAKGADYVPNITTFQDPPMLLSPRIVWSTTTTRICECRAQRYWDRSLSRYRWWRSELRSFHNSLGVGGVGLHFWCLLLTMS
ncbi:hypothetical protein ACEPAI_1363 [Sanghuangporus weigelae]